MPETEQKSGRSVNLVARTAQEKVGLGQKNQAHPKNQESEAKVGGYLVTCSVHGSNALPAETVLLPEMRACEVSGVGGANLTLLSELSKHHSTITFRKTMLESGINADNHLDHQKIVATDFLSRKRLVFCTKMFSHQGSATM